MAKISITSTCYIVRDLRRQYKHIGHTIRVKWGKIFIMKVPEYTYSRTLKQEACRERFRRAQEMMLEEFKNPEREEYWKRRADKEHYKTAKGCCKAYHYRNITEQDIQEKHRETREHIKKYKDALARGESGEKELIEKRGTTYKAACHGTESADEMKARRLATSRDKYEELIRRKNKRHLQVCGEVYLVKKKNLDEITHEDIDDSMHIFMRNGPRNMSLNKEDFSCELRRGRLKDFVHKRRKKHANDMDMYMPHLHGFMPYRKRDKGDKIILKSDIYPRFTREKCIVVTLDELQRYDYKKELETMDVCVSVAGRKVFLDAKLIDKLRSYRFLKKIRGIKPNTLESLRKLIAQEKRKSETVAQQT